MTSKNKAKGNGFENETAKFFNTIFNTTEFARTPGSGAWMGRSHAQKRIGVAEAAKDTLRGDLITPPNFPFIVECKINTNNPSYNNIIGTNDAKLDGWISEVEYDAEQSGSKFPLLVFKTPRKGTYIAIPSNYLSIKGINLDDHLSFYLKYDKYFIVSKENFEKIKDFFIIPLIVQNN